ncbi:hypothetical protein GCM10027343_37210 [Noviherbaspirillum agri]
MDTTHRDSVNDIDWAAAERSAVIKAASGRRTGVHAHKPAVWMEDASGVDGRSEKHQFKTGYSWRAAWWNVFSTGHQLFSRSGSLESAMYDFHRFHHAMTFPLLQIVTKIYALVKVITTDGAAKATIGYVKEEAKRCR